VCFIHVMSRIAVDPEQRVATYRSYPSRGKGLIRDKLKVVKVVKGGVFRRSSKVRFSNWTSRRKMVLRLTGLVKTKVRGYQSTA
jgi:hypothetical protein